MADQPVNLAASVKARLLNMAREQGRNFDILLVRFALERLLFRLARSEHRDRYVLKGGMLVTHWLEHDNRETRDMDFLGFGPNDAEAIKEIFAGIMGIEAEDGLVFDVENLAASPIREEMEYGGIRLRTSAYLERTRIPITLDIGFGDALPHAGQVIDYPSLLGMERPSIRSYSPETVIAEKFQAVVALGLANGRMKDFYDLWAVPRTMALDDTTLDAAIAATFARRQTAVPADCPPGLSDDMSRDPAAAQRWRAYIQSLDHPELSFADVLGDIWISLAPSCARILGVI